MNGIKSTQFWRKTYPVEAVRLTPENYQQIADYLGGEYFEDSPHQGPYIEYAGMEAVIGDWVVKFDNDRYDLRDHEDFMKEFHTHPERMADDEKYAKIFEIVISTMNKQASATYNGDNNGDMDLVAMRATRKILNEL